jgi:putrescine transport system ATP-binding protein
MSPSYNNNSIFAPWNDPKEKPLIEFKNVTKNFGSFTAIDNQSINIYEREFFSILGPSGCGKTTMMRMLGGFEIPTEGDILLDGQSITNIPPHKRPVNMMFQSYALFPHMNVEKNIAFGLKQEGMPKDQINDRVEEMINLVQLQQFAKRKPSQLSGGQRQRVALARSLAKKPKLLLLDEPLGALDKKLREETQFELMNIQESLGMTFVIVTHDQEEAMTVSSRIAVMDHGKIIQVESPADIYEKPNSRYIADFLGDVNIFEGKVASANDDAIQLEWAEGQEKLQMEASQPAKIGDSNWLAVRPEKISISKEKPIDADNILKGKIWDIGYTGNISVYHVQLPNGMTIKAQEVNRRRLANRELTWEDDVWISWRKTAGTHLVK